jgi:hypothetical protein
MTIMTSETMMHVLITAPAIMGIDQPVPLLPLGALVVVVSTPAKQNFTQITIGDN